MEYAIHVLHIFGVVITTIAYHLGPNSLHLLLLKSSVVKVRTKKRERERGREERNKEDLFRQIFQLLFEIASPNF